MSLCRAGDAGAGRGGGFLIMFEHKGVDVCVEGVSKTYRMAAEEVHALRESSWQVRKGEAVAIMGPSGCGKTTLLNLLGGVDRPTTGRILIDGQDLTQMNERALEKHRLLKVGFVFQFFNLIPSITAIENMELPMVMAGVPEAARGAERRRAAARRCRACAGQRPVADPGRRADGKSRQHQRHRDRQAAAVARNRLWQDGGHGEPRSEDGRRVSRGTLDARRPIRRRRFITRM